MYALLSNLWLKSSVATPVIVVNRFSDKVSGQRGLRLTLSSMFMDSSDTRDLGLAPGLGIYLAYRMRIPPR